MKAEQTATQVRWQTWAQSAMTQGAKRAHRALKAAVGWSPTVVETPSGELSGHPWEQVMAEVRKWKGV